MGDKDVFFIAVIGLFGIVLYSLARRGTVSLPDFPFSPPDTSGGFDYPADLPGDFYIPSDTAGYDPMALNPVMRLSGNGAAMIKQFEGFSATPYPDAGKVSIGYGHQIKPGEIYTSISRNDADILFLNDIQWAENAVNNWVSVPLSQGQFDALVSLVYNIGAPAFHYSTLLTKLNAGDYAGAADQFKVWNKSGGTFNSTLAARREVELETWFA